MKIMAINAGSSSLKFSLFEMNTKECIASDYFDGLLVVGVFPKAVAGGGQCGDGENQDYGQQGRHHDGSCSGARRR